MWRGPEGLQLTAQVVSQRLLPNWKLRCAKSCTALLRVWTGSSREWASRKALVAFRAVGPSEELSSLIVKADVAEYIVPSRQRPQ